MVKAKPDCYKATGLSRSSSPLPSRLQSSYHLGWLLGQLEGGGLA